MSSNGTQDHPFEDYTMKHNRIMARELRLACVTNVWKQGLLTDDAAKEILAGALTPGDDSSIVDDSALLGDPDGLKKIDAEEEKK